MPTAPTPLRYLLVAAATAVGLTAGAILLGIGVDPYRQFGTVEMAHWNALKPRAYQQSDLAKSYALQRVRPRTLLLGNSRIEVGIDPESPLWPARLRPVFNAAEGGHDVFSALLFLQAAIAKNPPRLVVLGVDFQDFIAAGTDPAEPPVTQNERRLLADRNGQSNANRTIPYLADFITATLTVDAVSDSIMTLLDQDPDNGVTMTAAGFNPLHQYRAAIRTEGAQTLFASKIAEYQVQYRAYRPSNFDSPHSNPEFRYLSHLLEAATSHHCEVVVIIYPYHAQYLEMLHELGLWQSFEDWKRAIVAVIEHMVQTSPASIRLIDFSGYNSFSQERVPPANDRHTQMRWYWEPGHFKSALGDLMIARMMGRAEDFGTVLVKRGAGAEQSSRSDETSDDPHLLARGAQPIDPQPVCRRNLQLSAGGTECLP